MKCIATFFLFLAAVAADGHGDEIDMIMQSKGKKAKKKKTVPVAGTSACTPQPLDANMLIAKVCPQERTPYLVLASFGVLTS